MMFCLKHHESRESNMTLTTIQPDVTLNLSGTRCPHTLLATIKALASMENGRFLQIIATDLNAPSNLTTWCRQSDHEMHEMYEENGKFVMFIRCTNQYNPEGDK